MAALTPPPIALSTASVYPETTPAAFEIAAALGYDGVEVMVWSDPVSQDVRKLQKLSERYSMPILAVHAPCLIISQRVWVRDARLRLELAVDAARVLDASTVVVHPPFRWQKRYAAGFREQVRQLNAEAYEAGIRIAVENMYPLRARLRRAHGWAPYYPHWDPTQVGHEHYTLDISHAAVSHTDPLEMAHRMGSQLAHVHLGDGTGLRRDEHLVPGRGEMPCAQVLEHVTASGFDGVVAVEVSTRHAKRDRSLRMDDLSETLQFARRHCGVIA